MKYQKHFQTRETPQSEPIPGTDQVQNRAGGYAWEIDKWVLAQRFLILGTEGGTYYASEHELTVQDATAIMACASEDGQRLVGLIVDISTAGRAPKNDPALFALAIVAGTGDEAARRAAFAALPKVARIGTHLFTFLGYCKAFRGWGRGMRRAVADWYNDRPLESLAYQVLKYRQRVGYTHRDALRLAHPKADGARNTFYHWIVKEEGQTDLFEALPILSGYYQAQSVGNARDVAALIREYGLTREMIPTEYLKEAVVWEALLEKMPMTAMVRNLGNMSKVGLLAPFSDAARRVVAELADEEHIRASRIHPIQVLAALRTYAQGQGVRGSGEWMPVPQVIDALDDAFYMAFGNVEPAGKRFLLGLDVSGSMTMGCVSGVPGLSPRVAAAAMAMVLARSEPQCAAVAFCDRLIQFPLSKKERLDDVCARMNGLPFGGTDCSLPILAALENNLPVDVFVTITDNETWAGHIHPAQVLDQYRRKVGVQAKNAVIGMTADRFSIADPEDPLQLDFVGFDSATPQALTQFALL